MIKTAPETAKSGVRIIGEFRRLHRQDFISKKDGTPGHFYKAIIDVDGDDMVKINIPDSAVQFFEKLPRRARVDLGVELRENGYSYGLEFLAD